jgi:hypothetical protein
VLIWKNIAAGHDALRRPARHHPARMNPTATSSLPIDGAGHPVRPVSELAGDGVVPAAFDLGGFLLASV